MLKTVLIQMTHENLILCVANDGAEFLRFVLFMANRIIPPEERADNAIPMVIGAAIAGPVIPIRLRF